MGRELCARIGGAGFRTLAYDISPKASKFAEENYENVSIEMAIYSPPIFGDVNTDGNLDILDIMILINY